MKAGRTDRSQTLAQRAEHGAKSKRCLVLTVLLLALGAGANLKNQLASAATIVGWGFDGFGQTQVPSGFQDAIAIAAGANHGMALRKSGTAVAWGDNSAGQCDVPAWLNNAISIAAGDSYSV